jgi:DsbC/DsbD-like thiol-disulfide interchange protein
MGARLYPEGSMSASNPGRSACSAAVRRRVLACAAIVMGSLFFPLAAPAAGPTIDARWRLGAAASDGTPAEIALVVTVEKGWHVNANDPGGSYLIPTTLEIDTPAGTTVQSIRYPDPVVRSLSFASGTTLRLYEGAFTIAVRVAGALPDHFDARLGYQACNEETCLPPRTVPVPFEAKTARGAQ